MFKIPQNTLYCLAIFSTVFNEGMLGSFQNKN